jgi:hypothetical protein
MALITDKEAPPDVPTTNELADIDTGEDETPPAYLSFGGSPAPLDEPPEVGDVRTYIVRARCTGEHGPIERKDGEMRYTRTMQIQSCHEQGKKPPGDGNQDALFDRNSVENGDTETDGGDDE